MINTSSGSHVPGHICCCPLQESNDALLDHCLWVVVLDVLDLMVPLLKRHFALPRSGITNKDVNSGDTILSPAASMLRRQPTSALAQGGPADCCVGLPGPSLGRSLPCHPLWPCCHPQGPSDCPRATPVGVQPLPLTISIWRALSTSQS